MTAWRVSAPADECPGAWVIADSGGCGAVVQGSRAVPREAWGTGSFAPEKARVRVSVDGAEVAQGVGSNIMLGHPLRSIEWLATHLGYNTQIGGQSRGLRAGELVIAGTMHGKTDVAPPVNSLEVAADFGSLLGTIAVRLKG